MKVKIKRYNDFNTYLRSLYNERVQKVVIDAGLTCPNRDGTLSEGGCIYCNDRGSGSGAHAAGMAIKDQMAAGIRAMQKRYNAGRFLAYFQSYTNTYTSVGHLQRMFDEALSFPEVAGIAIGTRPDCIDEAKLSLIASYAEKYLVWIEYGLQSCHDATLQLINRGHDFAAFERAVEMTRGRRIRICAHIILGLPGEDLQMMRQTAESLARLKTDGVKIHLLYVIKGTPLERMWQNGTYSCMTQSDYVEAVCDVIERLPPSTVIQRITGDPHPQELAAPDWCRKKNETLQMIHQRLADRDTFQGKRYQNSSANPFE